MPSPINIKPGDRFGKLTVLEEIGRQGQYRAFRLLCDCGRTKVKNINQLRRSTGPVRSCGCEQFSGLDRRTHGMSRSPTYGVWLGMLSRCRNPNSKSYVNYGGRGITVCERWHKFENFLADMGERPSAKHEIDRIEHDGNYEPGNVRWLDDASLQALNRRIPKNGTSQYRGVDWWNGQGWRARITAEGKVRDLGLFTDEEAAARAYDAVARLYKGYRLNFSEGA